MNRRQAAQVDQWAAQDAAGNPECGLCGVPMAVVWNGEEAVAFEVCVDCNRVFECLARDVEDSRRARARLEVVADVEHVAGQLELEDPLSTGGHSAGCYGSALGAAAENAQEAGLEDDPERDEAWARLYLADGTADCHCGARA